MNPGSMAPESMFLTITLKSFTVRSNYVILGAYFVPSTVPHAIQEFLVVHPNARMRHGPLLQVNINLAGQPTVPLLRVGPLRGC